MDDDMYDDTVNYSDFLAKAELRFETNETGIQVLFPFHALRRLETYLILEP